MKALLSLAAACFATGIVIGVIVPPPMEVATVTLGLAGALLAIALVIWRA